MSIRINLATNGLEQQVSLLQEFPEIAERHWKPMLQKDMAALRAQIEPQIPRSTGQAARSFGSRVTGKGTRLTGEVGWYRKGAPFYIRFLEGGAKPHEIEPRGSRVTLARFITGERHADVLHWDDIFAARIERHPGVRGRGFMAGAWTRVGPMVQADIAAANVAIVQELRVGS